MVGVALTVAACANLPTSGNVNVNSLHGAGGPGAIGSQVVPRAPAKGWRPIDIVSGFLTASASYGTDPSHKIAKEYLTQGKQGLAHKWRPGWAATIIDSPSFNQPASGLGPREQGGPQATSVVVTGKHLASLVTAGRYQAGSEVVQPTTTSYRFVLVQVGREWRISNIYVDNRPAPPSLLLLTRRDFDREYQSRNLYFYPAGRPRNALVPDPVFIPVQVGDKGISGLVQTLINPRLNNVNGPAAKLGTSWLFGAAQTAFPPGTQLLSAHLVGGITAVVNLGGTAAKTSEEQRQRMAAQLDLSLTYAPYPTQTANPVQSVVLKVNGHTFRQRTQGYASWVPRSSSGQLYYQVPESPLGPTVDALRPNPPRIGPFPLPTALAGQTFSTMAVSTARAGKAVVAGCSGHFVYLMPQSHTEHVIKLPRLMDACASLSWDEQGDLWIATKSQVYVVPAVGSELPAKPAVTGVLGPNLVKTEIESLRVAPDGVRVAMLLKSKLGARIRIAAISKGSGQYTYLAQTDQMLRVGTDVPDPIALTWLDSDHLLVLSQISQGKTQLYEVPLNGTQSTPVATPPGARSVSASRPTKLSEPVVAVVIPQSKNAAGRIETAGNGLLNPDWRQVARGTTPVFPG
jgi:two-component system sensor histidine kinase MtrB